jgi:hypothetical protein
MKKKVWYPKCSDSEGLVDCHHCAAMTECVEHGL